MATTRKRPSSSGFSPKDEDIVEDSTSQEDSQQDLEPTPTVAVEAPFVEQEIAPTPDVGPRFAEEPAPVAVAIAEPSTPTVIGKVPPKRHPRNIPKFSRDK